MTNLLKAGETVLDTKEVTVTVTVMDKETVEAANDMENNQDFVFKTANKSFTLCLWVSPKLFSLHFSLLSWCFTWSFKGFVNSCEQIKHTC